MTDSSVNQTHPIDDLQEVEEAIAFATEALNAAQRLEKQKIDFSGAGPAASKLLNIAVESYVERFQIPIAALEDSDLDAPAESKLKKVILYLYAIVERIFKAIFDFFQNQKQIARKIVPLTKQYIGAADSLSSAMAGRLSIKDRSLMKALHINGLPPKDVPKLFDNLAQVFEKQHSFVAVLEVARLVAAAKAGNDERVKKEAEELRNKLEHGLASALARVDDPQSIPVINEKKSDTARYYTSKPLFGHNVIVGIVGDRVSEEGSFRFNCSVRQDKEVPLRVDSFPVLTPDEIRRVCRTALHVCENIVRFSRDEELMQKALREATFLTSKEADKSAVAALRNIIAMGQNSYIVHLRFTARTMQAIMRWCDASIQSYESVGQSNG